MNRKESTPYKVRRGNIRYVNDPKINVEGKVDKIPSHQRSYENCCMNKFICYVRKQNKE